MRDMGDDMLLRYVIACFFIFGVVLDALSTPYWGGVDVCIAICENITIGERTFLIKEVNCGMV